MKILSLTDYIKDFHEGNQTKAAQSLINISTSNKMTQSAMFNNEKSGRFIVIVGKDTHTLCKTVASNTKPLN